MKYFIGLDDTDNFESRGTGHLARMMASALAQDFRVHGVIRHQLLEDEFACNLMRDDFQPGSDPGLCVASVVPNEVIAYGQRAQREFLYQQEPRELAAAHGLYLEGLGGDEGGVIGALAAIGLAASGDDGRYVQVGSIRDLEGLLPIANVLSAGITSVKTLDGEPVTEGLVLTDKLRPARRKDQPILFVERQEGHWLPLKLD
jgi:hypothetical protein